MSDLPSFFRLRHHLKSAAIAGLLSSAAVACDATPPQTAVERSSQPLVQRQSLLLHWAPVHYHDVNKNRWSGRGDFLTAFNYDHDWSPDNNWDNLNAAGVDLTASAYGKVAESTSHWFLFFAFYHPRDWVDSAVSVHFEEHENDVEGVVLFVRKDGSTFGTLEGMMTDHHGDISYYNAASNVTPVSGSAMQVEVLPGESHARPRTYQEAEGHGIWSCGSGGAKCDKRDEDGIKYVPGTTGGVPGAVGVWTPVSYAIRDMDEMWTKRLPGTSGIAHDGQPWSASAIYKTPGPRAYTLRGGKSGGCGDGWFRSCASDAANMVWSNEALSRDPAKFIADHFRFSGFLGAPPRSEYLKNDFNVDAAGGSCDDLTTAKDRPIDQSRACFLPCVQDIAAVDPFCVQTAWDGICVGEVETICGSPGVANQ